MCDRLKIHERCIAIQFHKEVSFQFGRFFGYPQSARENPLSPSSQKPTRRLRFTQIQYRSLPRTKTTSENVHKKCDTASAEALNFYDRSPKSLSDEHLKGETNSPKFSSPNSASDGPLKANTISPNTSTSSGTPTPTNAVPPVPCSSNGLGSPLRNGFHSYQEGYRLFQAWVETNLACVWDSDLVKAVTAARFVGILVGGFIVVGGSPRVLAAISHAHSRALLNAPPGWSIAVLGELQECEISVVQRSQFTPLGAALCWTVHKLTRAGITADQENIRNALLVDFPVMTPPEPSMVHTALSDLIHQRKIFHTNRGYGIVTERTYFQDPSAALVPQAKDNNGLSSRPTATSCDTSIVKVLGSVRTVAHVAVQTDLADLLSGIWPNSAILTPKPEPPPSNRPFQRTGSFRGSCSNAFLAEGDRSTGKERILIYVGHDMSDVTIKGGDKSSVLSKILRVSQPRRRLASFNAQFPPPEWSNANRHVKHLHSVATQTRSSKHPGGSENCWFVNVQWAPRSSTLPRRPPRALSSSPVPITAHFRPHSTSPATVKLSSHGGNSQSSTTVEGQKTHYTVSSSSPSPCVTSSHTSRNPSPSLYSTITHADCNIRYLPPPYQENPPQFKTAASSNNPEGTNLTPSPVRLKQGNFSPSRAVIKKPPPSGSPHHNAPKDQRRRALSLLPNESINLDNSSYRLDNNSHQRQDSSPQRQDNSHHREDIPHVSQDISHSRHENVHHRQGNSPHRQDNARHSRHDGSPRKQDKRSQAEGKVATRNCNGSPVRIKGKSKTNPLTTEESSNIARTERANEPDSTKAQLDRANLQLELTSEIHMNNYRKVVSSPQKPEGLKNNVFSSIAKGSSSDLTSKNMGYRDVNKCDKKLYAEETQHNSLLETKAEDIESSEVEPVKTPKSSLKQSEEKRRLKLSLPLSESDIFTTENLKKLHRKSLISLDNKIESSKDLEKNFLSSHEDILSVKTYPSLSDLNLTFSSLAAQKILQGVSVNSIDTLVEVNMIAEKRQQTTHHGVTNTDFGFV